MKRTYKASIIIIQIGFAIWLIETIAFLFIEGWHYKATTEIEIILDLISVLIMRIGLFMWFLSAAWIVNIIYKNEFEQTKK